MLERFILPSRGLDDMRMAMSNADRDDAAESIEIALARLVPDILHPPLDEHQWLLVVEKNSGIEKLLPKREDLVSGGTRVRVGLKGEWRKGNFFHHLSSVKNSTTKREIVRAMPSQKARGAIPGIAPFFGTFRNGDEEACRSKSFRALAER